MIGSGLGGLVSALILAMDGQKVAVLEKNVQFGGNLQSFSRKKCLFDSGVHYLGGLSEGQNLYRYFDFLGTMEDLKVHKMDEVFDQVIFEDDILAYPLAQGYEAFVDNLSQIFPEEKSTLQKYVDDLQLVSNAFPRYQPGGLRPLRPELLAMNAKNYFDQLTQNQKLKAVLCGQSFLYGGLESETPFYLHALTVNSYVQSAWKCVNGGSSITKALLKQLKSHGAEVFKRAEVTGFDFDEERIISVKTNEGKVFFAKNFISNIDLKKTVQLVGRQHFKKAYTNRIDSLQPSKACFSVYLVLKPKSIAYQNHNFYHFKNAQSCLGAVAGQPDFYMLSFTPSRQHPEFAESCTIITYMDFSEVEQWGSTFNTAANPKERAAGYEKFKQEKAAEIIRLVGKKFPEIEDAVSAVYTSSPLSYRDYIGCEAGGMYGYKVESSHPMAAVFSPKTKVPNLFLTGQSVNMHGILGVTIGAFSTCSEILGKEIFTNENH